VTDDVPPTDRSVAQEEYNSSVVKGRMVESGIANISKTSDEKTKISLRKLEERMTNRILGKMAGALTASVVVATSAHGALYMTPTGAAGSDGSVSASAIITLGNGTATVVLSDLQGNEVSAGQTLSGLLFDVSGATGSASLVSSAGRTTSLQSDGSYTPGVYTSPLAHWGADNGVNLSTIGIVGAKPYDLILGPDSAGGFNNAGTYSASNQGMRKNFNPYVLGTATFTVDIPGITAASTISGVDFEFGTGPDFVVAGHTVVVPEPTTMIAGALLLLPFGASTLRFVRKNRVA